MPQLLSRAEVAPEHTWNAPSVFASLDEWSHALDETTAALPAFKQTYEGHLGSSPATLAEYLTAYQDLIARVYRIYVYASMTYACDTSDQQAGAMRAKALALFGQARAATAFAQPEMIAIGRDTAMAWIDANPALATYRHLFEDLFRQQEHVRSAEVEEVLGQMIEPFASADTTNDILTNAELTFQPVKNAAGESLPVAQGTIDTLLNSPERDVRRAAWESYCDGYLAFKNTQANMLLTSVKQGLAMARVRRYDSTLQMALFPHNLPEQVFHTLIDTFRKHLPTWHRYWRVLRRALKVETLHHWDIWAPITQNQPTIPYSEAVAIIAAGMAPLGPQYVDVLRNGCTMDRWVDVYPNRGKQQGAFSAGSYDTFPFIMMNYDDHLSSVSTLAHELGHSMHSYFSNTTQPLVYADYSSFVAEVASNFNQAMVRAYTLGARAEPDFQIAQIQEAMDNFHRYFFIMPTLARFEFEVHNRVAEGNSPTADEMNALMADLFSEGYGGELVVDREREGITWAQFPHLYAHFYPFQYATGISAAHALADRVLSGEPGAVEDYLGFLKSGSSAYPLDVLKRAGADLTTPEPVERAFKVLAGLVDRLETLVG
ncbi:MAG: oligoendopeptidase F [Anaerolineae bacterium]|nr:oligoendopeptidase F [Anaerolineae bacterium]